MFQTIIQKCDLEHSKRQEKLKIKKGKKETEKRRNVETERRREKNCNDECRIQNLELKAKDKKRWRDEKTEKWRNGENK